MTAPGDYAGGAQRLDSAVLPAGPERGKRARVLACQALINIRFIIGRRCRDRGRVSEGVTAPHLRAGYDDGLWLTVGDLVLYNRVKVEHGLTVVPEEDEKGCIVTRLKLLWLTCRKMMDDWARR